MQWASPDILSRVRRVRRTDFVVGVGAFGASSSMVEQRAFNPLVQGSSPWGRTLCCRATQLTNFGILHTQGVADPGVKQHLP
jgi:hypothetical protein